MKFKSKFKLKHKYLSILYDENGQFLSKESNSKRILNKWIDNSDFRFSSKIFYSGRQVYETYHKSSALIGSGILRDACEKILLNYGLLKQ